MPPSRSLNYAFARNVVIPASTLVRNSIVPAAALNAPTPFVNSNTQALNPSNAGYCLNNINTRNSDSELHESPPTSLPEREPFNLIYGPRPQGTPGREDFDLPAVLGLKRHEYVLCLRIMRHIGYRYGIDESQSISAQEDHILTKCYLRFLDTFEEFKGFHDQFWAPRAIMYVALKSSSESWRRNNPELAAARANINAMKKEASKAASRAKKANQKPRGRPKGKGKAINKGKGRADPQVFEHEDPVDRMANDIGNMSLDPDVAAALANMSVDPTHNADDDYAAPDEPFFNSELLAFAAGNSGSSIDPRTSYNVTSTPHAHGRYVAQSPGSQISAVDHVGDPIPNRSYGQGAIPVPDHTHTLRSNGGVIQNMVDRYPTNTYTAAQTTIAAKLLGHEPEHSATYPHDSSITGVPGPNSRSLSITGAAPHVTSLSTSLSQQSPPVRLDSRSSLSSALQNSQPLSAHLNSRSSSIPADSRDLRSQHSSNTAHRSQGHTNTRTSNTQSTNITRAVTAPSSTYSRSSSSVYNDTTYGPQDSPVADSDLVSTAHTHDSAMHATLVPSNRQRVVSAINHLSTHNVPSIKAAHPAIEDPVLAPPQLPLYNLGSTGTRSTTSAPGPASSNNHIQLRPRAPPAILALAANASTVSTAVAQVNTQVTRNPATHSQSKSTRTRTVGSQNQVAGFESDGELSDAPSATASNYPVESDSEVPAHTPIAEDITGPKTRRKKAQPVVDDEGQHLEIENGRGRGSRGSRGGRGSRGSRGGSCGGGVDGGSDRGRGRGRGSATRGRGRGRGKPGAA